MSSNTDVLGSTEKLFDRTLDEHEESEALPPDFIDDFMQIMDNLAAKKNLMFGDAFIPGNQDDVVL
jgi:hypothetical protein